MTYLKIYFTALILAISIGIGNAKTHNETTPPTETTCQSTIKTEKHQLKGDATFYGNKYRRGRKTASGKPFDKNKLTAAHKTLPFGTVVLVTNKNTGKSVKVTVTDRGPFGRGKVIDLSPKAFRQIADLKTGVIPVKLTVISIPKA